MLEWTRQEKELAETLKCLKAGSGSHSPSLSSLTERLPQLKIQVDACFLSNPYATDLFLQHLHDEIISTNRLKTILANYPAQNRVIADGDYQDWKNSHNSPVRRDARWV